MPEKGKGWFEYTRDKTVYVLHYYFYVDDEELGPAFVKVCSYAPWALKVCVNGHEWAKRQLEKRGIAYESSSRTGGSMSRRVFHPWCSLKSGGASSIGSTTPDYA